MIFTPELLHPSLQFHGQTFCVDENLGNSLGGGGSQDYLPVIGESMFEKKPECICLAFSRRAGVSSMHVVAGRRVRTSSKEQGNMGWDLILNKIDFLLVIR